MHDADHAIDDTLDMGPCCVCETTGPSVRNILMLPKKGHVPGHGWGCVVCHLPPDGATAVVCDACFAAKATLRFVCRGWPAVDGRVPIDELLLQENHQHDPEAHRLHDLLQTRLN